MEKTKTTQHPFDCLVIRDRITSSNAYLIQVFLDCSCGSNEDKPVVSFIDNPLFTAEKLFFAWFSEVAPWFIQQGYKIIDNRKGKECENEN